MTFTSVNDVATELGRPILESERAQVQQWIERVENRIRTRIPSLDELIQDPTYLITAKGVVVAVVARKVINPEGMRSERIDDYYYDRGSASADLWPTDAEWAELLPDTSTGAFSTRPGFEPDRDCAPWPL